jgi:hypothetical protein
MRFDPQIASRFEQMELPVWTESVELRCFMSWRTPPGDHQPEGRISDSGHHELLQTPTIGSGSK